MPKVLVVDDSLSVRKVVEKALEGRGLEVLSAASGSEAIEVLERDRPDVVICDVILPDKDGYQICQYVRSHPAIGTTPVLLISGIDNGTVQARARRLEKTARLPSATARRRRLRPRPLHRWSRPRHRPPRRRPSCPGESSSISRVSRPRPAFASSC
ncbi:MAG: hypothetical protein DME03_05410 [Candidatus Rokuibacteriota bacterium]|nr:MAG: hypothetical protein DME03_05410 [Candidatus Rokubacteria bacterium]